MIEQNEDLEESLTRSDELIERAGEKNFHEFTTYVQKPSMLKIMKQSQCYDNNILLADDQEFRQYVEEAIHAIHNGHNPEPWEQESGLYRLRDAKQNIFGVFRPKYEEKKSIAVILSTTWSKIVSWILGREPVTTVPYQRYLADICASIIDRTFGLNIVPKTKCVVLSSPAFKYTLQERMMTSTRQRLMCSPFAELPKKIGSMQCYRPSFEDIDSAYEDSKKFLKRKTAYFIRRRLSDDLKEQFQFEFEKYVVLTYLIGNTDCSLKDWRVKCDEIYARSAPMEISKPSHEAPETSSANIAGSVPKKVVFLESTADVHQTQSRESVITESQEQSLNVPKESDANKSQIPDNDVTQESDATEAHSPPIETDVTVVEKDIAEMSTSPSNIGTESKQQPFTTLSERLREENLTKSASDPTEEQIKERQTVISAQQSRVDLNQPSQSTSSAFVDIPLVHREEAKAFRIAVLNTSGGFPFTNIGRKYSWQTLTEAHIRFSQRIRRLILDKLCDKNLIKALVNDIEKEFRRDDHFVETMLTKQMSIMRGQMQNLIEVLRDDNGTPLQLALLSYNVEEKSYRKLSEQQFEYFVDGLLSE